MSEPEKSNNPLVAMAAGGFIGGMVAGAINAGAFAVFVLILGCSYALLLALGHIGHGNRAGSLGSLIGLSTVIPLPCGLIGLFLGKALFGS